MTVSKFRILPLEPKAEGLIMSTRATTSLPAAEWPDEDRGETILGLYTCEQGLYINSAAD